MMHFIIIMNKCIKMFDITLFVCRWFFEEERHNIFYTKLY